MTILRKATVAAVICATVVRLGAEDEKPLQLDLPQPLFAGTPIPVQLPNLEKPVPGKRREFMVPAGTVKLSAGKPVTCSDKDPLLGDPSFVTDGQKSGEDGTYLELGPGPQWVQIDLGASDRLAAIVVWHYFSEPRAYRDVVVQTSDDPAFKSGVTTLFNNDSGNAIGLGVGRDPAYIETNEGRLIDARRTRARYVRLYSNGNTTDEMNDYIEVEVYGTPRR